MHCRQSPRAPRSCCPSIFLNRTPVTQVRGPRIWAGAIPLQEGPDHPRRTQSPPLRTAASSSPSSLCPPSARLPPTAPGYLLCGPVGLCQPGHQAGAAPGLTGVSCPSHPGGQLPATSPSPRGASRGLHRHLSPSSMGLSFPALLGLSYPRWPSSQSRCSQQE